MAAVRRYEVEEILAGCKALKPDYKPGIAYVVVNRRPSDRFFIRKNDIKSALGMNSNSFEKQFGRRGKVLQNPIPGTIITDDLVREDRYEFFLGSQNVTQGSLTATKYVVVEDTTGFKEETIWDITYS